MTRPASRLVELVLLDVVGEELVLEARSSPALDDFPPFVKSYVLGHGQHTALLLHLKGSQLQKKITRAFFKKKMNRT